eukprot:TRINITY_DN32451_c0_g1_i1.p1 TRINITY_DN32451_c0_g1~~TRINITY_DN32451_c0_g1_i1.p1  ORF type:complete len:221 (+),score=15.34 TRINITY_DN32451_c0_g1_i1:52-663(+)
MPVGLPARKKWVESLVEMGFGSKDAEAVVKDARSFSRAVDELCQRTRIMNTASLYGKERRVSQVSISTDASSDTSAAHAMTPPSARKPAIRWRLRGKQRPWRYTVSPGQLVKRRRLSSKTPQRDAYRPRVSDADKYSPTPAPQTPPASTAKDSGKHFPASFGLVTPQPVKNGSERKSTCRRRQSIEGDESCWNTFRLFAVTSA